MRRSCQFALSALVAVGIAAPALASPRGAIFTTVRDGSIVNENVHYGAKEDVYLDGGPGGNAPSSAAALAAGDYYFQVTDPSGKVLLSTDPVESRRFRVNAAGLIDAVSNHVTGLDVDHGALTVQLMPYLDTPNPGGVYKVWVTPVARFVGNPRRVDNPAHFHGFMPGWSKTDNYKVRAQIPPPPCGCESMLRIRKFIDCDQDGIWDVNEQESIGWIVFVTDPLGATNEYTTPAEILVTNGTWIVEEDSPVGSTQTVILVDGQPAAQAILDVAGGLDREVVFGNWVPDQCCACSCNTCGSIASTTDTSALSAPATTVSISSTPSTGVNGNPPNSAPQANSNGNNGNTGVNGNPPNSAPQANSNGNNGSTGARGNPPQSAPQSTRR